MYSETPIIRNGNGKSHNQNCQCHALQMITLQCTFYTELKCEVENSGMGVAVVVDS